MAKRVRGTTSRPGQRPPLQRGASTRPATQPVAVTAPAVRPDTLTDEEEARAAELEAAIVAEEKQAEAATKRTQTARTVEPAARASSLEVSAAEEYAYVARDVRRITIVGGSLILILLGLWVIAHVAGLGPL